MRASRFCEPKNGLYVNSYCVDGYSKLSERPQNNQNLCHVNSAVDEQSRVAHLACFELVITARAVCFQLGILHHSGSNVCHRECFVFVDKMAYLSSSNKKKLDSEVNKKESHFYSSHK